MFLVPPRTGPPVGDAALKSLSSTALHRRSQESVQLRPYTSFFSGRAGGGGGGKENGCPCRESERARHTSGGVANTRLKQNSQKLAQTLLGFVLFFSLH